LVECVGAPGKIFFCNSGAEANEALYKLARKYGNEALPPPPRHVAGALVESPACRHGIITMEGSFHGRTLGGIAATGQDKVKKGFEPILSGFQHVPFNDLPALLVAVQDPNPCRAKLGSAPQLRNFCVMREIFVIATNCFCFSTKYSVVSGAQATGAHGNLCLERMTLFRTE
jgi:hypothetical protein